MYYSTSVFPQVRMRRLRAHPRLRDLVRETVLTANDFILPLFVRAGKNVRQPITSMPGQYQLSIDALEKEIAEIVSLHLPAVILFGIPENKDAVGSDALLANGVISQAVHRIKALAPQLLVMVDLCCCEYTDHGHCGILQASPYDAETDQVDNDATLSILAKQAVVLARAGADVIAPSGMMDGAVLTIRQALDSAGFQHIPILSYAVKYASACYGPFREAAEGAPQFGDRRNHQMDPANGREALREAWLDIQEGADMLMVKPAAFYLDIIAALRQHFSALPIAAYQVSGEYAMIKAAAAQGWIDEKSVVLESLLAIKRAGADLIISYFAKDVLRWL